MGRIWRLRVWRILLILGIVIFNSFPLILSQEAVQNRLSDTITQEFASHPHSPYQYLPDGKGGIYFTEINDPLVPTHCTLNKIENYGNVTLINEDSGCLPLIGTQERLLFLNGESRSVNSYSLNLTILDIQTQIEQIVVCVLNDSQILQFENMFIDHNDVYFNNTHLSLFLYDLSTATHYFWRINVDDTSSEVIEIVRFEGTCECEWDRKITDDGLMMDIYYNDHLTRYSLAGTFETETITSGYDFNEFDCIRALGCNVINLGGTLVYIEEPSTEAFPTSIDLELHTSKDSEKIERIAPNYSIFRVHPNAFVIQLLNFEEFASQPIITYHYLVIVSNGQFYIYKMESVNPAAYRNGNNYFYPHDSTGYYVITSYLDDLIITEVDFLSILNTINVKHYWYFFSIPISLLLVGIAIYQYRKQKKIENTTELFPIHNG